MSQFTGRDVVRGLRWYLREVTGESAYDRYVQDACREHPNAPLLDRNAFERARQDRRDHGAPQRCC